MTHTQTIQTSTHPDPNRSVGTVLAVVCGGLSLLLAAAGGWVAWSTHLEGLAAGPDADTSLYGLGYLLAMVLGGFAAVAGIGAVTGWAVSRRWAGAGLVVLAVTAALVVLPAVWLVGIFL